MTSTRPMLPRYGSWTRMAGSTSWCAWTRRRPLTRYPAVWAVRFSGPPSNSSRALVESNLRSPRLSSTAASDSTGRGPAGLGFPTILLSEEFAGGHVGPDLIPCRRVECPLPYRKRTGDGRRTLPIVGNPPGDGVASQGPHDRRLDPERPGPTARLSQLRQLDAEAYPRSVGLPVQLPGDENRR